MKKRITTLLLLAGLYATAQVKIGDNPTTIGSSSVLELESPNKAFVITRVANTAAITSPTNGMLIYDLSSNCVKFYENGVWSNCISTGTSSVVQGILAQIGLEADNPNVLPSTVTAVQLSQVGVTGVTPANIGAYQAYIDANPDSFSNPATVSEIQAAVTAVNATVTSVLAQIGNEGDNPNTVTSVVTVEQLESVGITGVTEDNIGAYQAYIDANPDAFSNPATVSEIQTAISNVNTAVSSVLTQIGNEGDSPNLIPSVVTVAQLNSIGVTGVTASNIGAYQAYIDANPNSFSSPATVSEIQAAVAAVNTNVTSVLAQIGNEGDNPNSVPSVVTVAQLQSIGITGINASNIGAYQAYIDANPDAFSSPATLSEIQAAVSSVNTAVSSVLTQIGNEGDNPNTVPSVVTAAQLQSIGITGINAANIGAYQAYIDANPDSFSSPASLSEVQAAVTAVNSNVTSVLAQIGNEGDSPNTVPSVVTIAQLQSIGITGITADNIGAYQAYIDANPNSFSSPALLSEVQAAVTAVNSGVTSVLAQIGNEGDSPNTVPSVVTVAQLQSIGITGINASNIGAYQAYIDANPDSFSSPASLSEIQAAVTAVNSNVTSVLTQIGNEGDSPNTVPSVVTIAQLQSIGITGITADNIGAYQAYIDANPNSFSSPALLSEVQSAVTAVNSGVTSVLAQIGNEGDNPDTVNSVVTAAQLQSIGITGVTPGNEVAYQDYIDTHPDAFSSPASLSEIQAAVAAVNTSAATSGGTATVSGFTCNTASAGTLTKGTAASGVTQTITATVTTAGTYNITATANGVTFTGTGTFAGTSAQDIVLTASGTPTAAGSNNFTLSTTPGCSFTRSTIDAGSGGTAAVSSWNCTGTLTGVAAQGVAVSGLTKVVTADVSTAGSYSITATANGITFSGSGTFAGTGSQNITLTASGTPTAAGTHSFTINSTPSCSFDVTTKTLTAVDYAFVMRSGSVQTITSVNTDVVFDNKIAGNLPYNTSTGVFTLTAGKTYRLTSNLRLHTISSNTVDIYIDWVDASTNASISGNVGSSYQPLNSPNDHSAKTVSDIIYTPASNQMVKLRVTYLNGASFTVGQWESSATVQELGMLKSGSTFTKVDYVATRQSANQTINSGSNDLILNTNTEGNIPYNTSTGIYTLTAGKTYHFYFEGRLTSWSAADAMDITWVDASTNIQIVNVWARPQTNTSTNGANSVCNVEFIYTPATNQSIKIRTTLGSGTAILSSATAHIYQLGNDRTLGTVAYNTSNATGSISIPAAGVNLPMNNTLNGTITHNTTTGAYTLEAGKTYRMTFAGTFDFTGDPSGGSLGIYWVDSSTNIAVLGAGSFFVPTTNGGLRTSNNQLTAIYTPTVTQTVVPRVTYSASSGAVALSSNNVDRVVIEELGVNAN